ncbi:MAG: DNA-directed RNA polymerase subunit alpha, partial [Oricola sp.]|nr:DNA-directed RNA polymerase subunit alpha [Oricola sp.]
MIHKNWQELIKPKKVEFKSGGTNKVTLVAEPLERGFGL